MTSLVPRCTSAGLVGGLVLGGAAGYYLGSKKADKVEGKYGDYWPRKKRLDAYAKDTYPVLDRYSPKGFVCKIDGGQELNKVWSDVQASLKRK